MRAHYATSRDPARTQAGCGEIHDKQDQGSTTGGQGRGAREENPRVSNPRKLSRRRRPRRARSPRRRARAANSSMCSAQRRPRSRRQNRPSALTTPCACICARWARSSCSRARVKSRSPSVDADSIFPTCAEVKFPSWRVPMISRLGDRLLQFLVADRGGAAVVPGLAR